MRARRYRLYCNRHYELNRPDRVACSEDNCNDPSSSRGFCRTHYERWRKHGDASVALEAPVPHNGTGADNPTWRGDGIGYTGAHMRVRRERGVASVHSCTACEKPAIDWAYDHADPNEKIGMHDGYSRVYSTDPSHYVPMCKSCHKRFDLEHRRKPIE
jgi:hypothetical protein